MNVHEWNQQQLRRNGVKQNAAYPKAVVRVVGDAKQATLIDGTVVKRVDRIFVAGYGRFVKCAPYELHFIYEVPNHIKGWSLMCSCGSIAGVVGYRAYSKVASPTDDGLMIVCVRHLTTKQNTGIGRHADESTE